MRGRRGRHQLQADPLINIHRSTAVVNGQGQEIGLGDLARAEQARPPDQTWLEQDDQHLEIEDIEQGASYQRPASSRS